MNHVTCFHAGIAGGTFICESSQFVCNTEVH